MIISRTSLRIEFTGGSDLPAFYHHEPGAIVNVTINKYIYILIRHAHFFEKQNHNSNILIRETLKYRKIKNICLTSFSDLPSQTGLGSSGSFVVGLLTLLNHLEGKIQTPKQVAHEAFHIEGKLAKVNCGPQDQLAASFGGLKLHQFFPDNTKTTAINCSPKIYKKLQDNLLLFYTGNKRSSHNLLDNLSMTLKKNAEARKLMARRVKLSHLMAKTIKQNSLDSFGEMLDEEWNLKKTIAPIETNSFIDTIYSKAIKNGAKGGKLVGAGGSGFMLFYAPKEKHPKIKKALLPLASTNFKFTKKGSEVIHS